MQLTRKSRLGGGGGVHLMFSVGVFGSIRGVLVACRARAYVSSMGKWYVPSGGKQAYASSKSRN